MTAKGREWPPWWEWELKFTDYTYKRMKERDCTEIEVHRMMEHATNYYRSKEEGRWVIETRFWQKPWEIVVEPNAEKERLDVVTVYEVWDVK